jgi:GntR family transcriptional regulator
MALLYLDDKDPRPIYVQLAAQVKEQVRKGTLRPGDELPSVRDLAGTLGINLHTVHRAYQILRDDAVILLRLGRRPRIGPLRHGPADSAQVQARIGWRLNELITEAFHLGLSPKDFRALVDEKLLTEKGKK